MKAQYFILILILLLTRLNTAFADRILDRSEILEIFQILTEQHRNTWIQKGTIEGKRIKFETSTGFITESEHTVQYDGERFTWRITMNSRTKVIEGTNEQKVIFEDRLDFKGSKERIFIWDGESYTLCFKSGKEAIVREEPTDIPVVVNGPLTAGIIPWGFGTFSYESLIEMNFSAKEVEVEGNKQIHINLDGNNMPNMFFVLDTSKEYAMLSCSINYENGSITTRTYDDYTHIDNKWIPTTIIIEKYDAQQVLLAYDNWQITSISPIISNSFDSSAYFDKDILIQYHSKLIDKPLFYKSNNAIDSQSLLMNKLAMEVSWQGENEEYHNCATAAVEYALDSMNIPVNSQQMRSLVKTNEKHTNLYDLKNFIENKELYCKAVKGCNIKGFSDIPGDYRVIIYLPVQKHYVVLAQVDGEQVWLIDMDSRKFLYNVEVDKFNAYMESGAYLLISSQPLILNDSLIEIKDEQLNQFTGGQTGYCCTEKIQSADYVSCSDMNDDMCVGIYEVWLELYKCAPCENGNECFGGPELSSYWDVCIEDMNNIGNCTIAGAWIPEYARACLSLD